MKKNPGRRARRHPDQAEVMLPTPVKTAILTWLLNRKDQPDHGFAVDPLHTWNAAQPEVDKWNRQHPVSTSRLVAILLVAIAALVLVTVLVQMLLR